MARLTDISIRNAKPDTSDRLLSDGGNLFLRVRPMARRAGLSASSARASAACIRSAPGPTSRSSKLVPTLPVS